MSDLTPTLYLPIEETNRELDSKLLIAMELLGDGVTVIVGRSSLITANYGAMPPGAIVYKGMNAIAAYLMKQASLHGYAGLAIDEEALGLAGLEELGRNVDASIGPECGTFFAQGRQHAEAIRHRIPDAADRISIVGNSRIDVLREPFNAAFRDQVVEHRRVHGDYVLIDSNFGAINSQWGGPDAFKKVLARVGWMDPSKPEDEAYFAKRIQTEEACIVLLRRTLERLADQFPRTTFILRPHPAERPAPWRKAYEHRPNILVTSEGSHIPWILGSRLLLHAGCTTGLEAEILGTPSLTLLPKEHESLISSELISNIANHRVVGVDQAVEIATRVLSGEETGITSGRGARRRALDGHLEALEGDFAYKRIASRISAVLASAMADNPGYHWAPRTGRPFMTTKREYEQRLGQSSRTDYIWSKSSIDLGAFQRRLQGLADVVEVDFSPRISEIADSLFQLNAAPS